MYLSPDWRQLAIESTVSSVFDPRSSTVKSVFDRRLSGVNTHTQARTRRSIQASWAQTCNCFFIDLIYMSLVNCDSHNSPTFKWLPQNCSLASDWPPECIDLPWWPPSLSLFGLGSWPPYSAANLHRKKYECKGSHFLIPCLKIPNIKSKLLANVQQLSFPQVNTFFFNADMLLLKFTPDHPPNFLPNRCPLYTYRSVTSWWTQNTNINNKCNSHTQWEQQKSGHLCTIE